MDELCVRDMGMWGGWNTGREREWIWEGLQWQEGCFHCTPAKRNLWISGWHVWLPRRLYSLNLSWLLWTLVIPHCLKRMAIKGWGPPQCLFSNVDNIYTTHKPITGELLCRRHITMGRLIKSKRNIFLKDCNTHTKLEWPSFCKNWAISVINNIKIPPI